MHTKPATTDERVRNHFDGQMELYVDLHKAKHYSICLERIALLRRCLPFTKDDRVRLLDVGCGAGYLSDAFLLAFPHGQAIGVDVSVGMLCRNTPDDRKLLAAADARSIPFSGAAFDVINFDTVLHHVIDSGGYGRTIQGIAKLLASLAPKLNPEGAIMIREIYHEFWLWRSLGCRLLHLLTCTHLPKPLAALVRAAGIQTVNVGICFLTRGQWRTLFRKSGYQIVSQTDHRWPSPLRFFGFSSGEVYYFLKPAGDGVR